MELSIHLCNLLVFYFRICSVALTVQPIQRQCWCVSHLSHGDVWSHSWSGPGPVHSCLVCFNSQSSRLNQPFVSSAADCAIMFYSSNKHRHLPVFIKDSLTHQARTTMAFIFHLNQSFWIIKRVTPFTFFPVLISHAFQGCRTHICPFFQHSSLSFFSEGEIITQTNTHQVFFPPMWLFLSFWLHA